MKVIYSFFIWMYKLGFILVSPFHKKVKHRLYSLAVQKREYFEISKDRKNKILFIVASLGEYEQARPILDWVLNNTDYSVVVSFFSPSGYQNAELPDSRVFKVYTPFDLSGVIKNYITAINPIKVLFVKNELWWNLLNELRERNIETHLVSTTFRKDQYFIKNSLRFFRDGLKSFRSIYVTDNRSAELVKPIYDGQVLIVGDSKFDKVIENRKFSKKKNKSYKTVIYGSVWKSDLTYIKKCILDHADWVHILYPHDLSEKNIASFTKHFNKSSTIIESTIIDSSGVYINTSMGKLKYDYGFADYVYIGGGFGEGIHNVIEASIYGVPVFVGNKIYKNREAMALVKKGVVFQLENENSLCKLIDSLSTDDLLLIENVLQEYFEMDQSPTQLICKSIFAV